MPGTLRDDILSIPGIDDAHLEGDATSPDGVRVRLSYGADPRAVGREVRRILALHGMRSQLTDVPDRVAPEEPPPPPAPDGTVVNLADYENDSAAAESVAAMERESAEVDAPEPESAELEPDAGSDEPAAYEADETAVVEDVEILEEAAVTDEVADESSPVAAVGDAPATEETEGEAPAAAADEEAPDGEAATDAATTGISALGNVAVIEGAGGVTVTASTQLGKTRSRTAPATPAGVDRAVVSAVARLLKPEDDPPLLVEIMDTERGDETILTVVLELDSGDHSVGSAIQVANRSWAVARATRAALSGPA